MAFAIKQLTQGDLGHFKALLSVFADAFEDKLSYQSAVPSDAYLAAQLSKKDLIVLVALDGQEVVGGIAAYVLTKFEQERKEIYLYDLAVAAPYRRQGIATALINKLKEVAKEVGAYVIFVQADEGDEAAIKLYESFASKESVYQFDIDL